VPGLGPLFHPVVIEGRLRVKYLDVEIKFRPIRDSAVT